MSKEFILANVKGISYLCVGLILYKNLVLIKHNVFSKF
jgi:uncharacterized membrane protein YesL